MNEMLEPNQPNEGDQTSAPVKPPSDDQAGPEGAGRERKPRGAVRQIASEEECLAALTRLPGLNLARVIDDRQTNAFKGIYVAILQHHARKQASPRAVLEQPGLIEALRRNPELANLLEPLLSDEQIEALMSQTRDAPEND